MKNEEESKELKKLGDKKGLKPEIVKSIKDKKKIIENDKIVRK